ncbi:MAG: xylan 1,4-beta-xylosidase [Lachnospiraceae bacterium]|nr:xylan 1,4-beta-xylosidase [Lachnospiraceae bacterium]
MPKKRFEKVYNQGITENIEIWLDRETGVNYLWRKDAYAGGLTPLLDKDGKPVVTWVSEK